jgi:glycosyltransferase involved in cell wall biosynthesis
MLLELMRAADNFSVALVISTYNRPDALAKVLTSVASMEQLPDELFIADDGSGESTRQLVDNWKRQLDLIHVWQEDDGFRLSAARNNAIRKSKSDYIIFVDGDCVLPSNFIAKHRQLAERGCFVPGSRILLSEAYTRNFLEKGQAYCIPDGVGLFMLRLKGSINRLSPLFGFSTGWWRKWRKKSWKRIRGCNMAFWRSDLIKVNGFDEDFDHWGHEDADIAVRLIRSGVYRKDGILGSYVFHLWHPENKDSSESSMYSKLGQSINGERPVFAIRGLRSSQ